MKKTDAKKTEPIVKHIYVIGCGGVGGILIHFLWKMFNKKGVTLTIVDGDTFTISNLDRQYFSSFGNKANVIAEYIVSQPSCFLKVKPIQNFYYGYDNRGPLFQEGGVVMCAADNHWTRITAANKAKELQNVIYLSGGNEYTDGNVQYFVHKGGKLVAGDYLETYHPEFKEPMEMPSFNGSCDTKSDPQLLVTNLNVATIMLNTLWSVLENNRPEYSEVYFDVIKNKSRPIIRKK